MRNLPLTIAVSASVAFFSTAAIAAPIAPSNETTCTISGWSMDADPHGLNVRSAPNAKASIVGTLPGVRSGDAFPYAVGPSFDIIGSANGWLKITNANDNDSRLIDKEPRTTYAGSGWIWGGKVGLKIQSTRGFEKPDKKSTVVIDTHQLKHPVYSGHMFDGDDAVANVIACDGPWVLADVRPYDPATDKPSKHTTRAWFRGVCSLRETTCSGITGD